MMEKNVPELVLEPIKRDTVPEAIPVWDVAIPVPLRKKYAYRVPENLGSSAPGVRVLVPFGRRRLVGYLIEPTCNLEKLKFKIKPIISILDDKPVLSEELLSFLQLSASYYMHPLGEVLRTALPPGIDPTERKGSLKGPRIQEKKELVALPSPHAIDALSQIKQKAPKRATVLETIISQKRAPMGLLKKVAKDANKHVVRLQQDGLITTQEEIQNPDPFYTKPETNDTPPVLTQEQQEAVDRITSSIAQGTYHGFLLHGITGSGKTEVYLHAIEEAHKQGKGAIVLVPEITLTPQLVRRYRARFGDALAVWHSGLSDRERFDQWRLLRSGKVNVAIGVRSAVFAPVNNLGIIVVDEEHDGSFKQERGFPYSARDLSILRASKSQAVVLLGSATPALETTQNAATGKLTRLELKNRATNRELPSIELINLTQHRNGPAGQRVITGPLYQAIADTLDRKEQCILFLNRRGFAPSLICKSCGEAIRCDDCAVSLTLHKKPPSLTCHYCGANRPIPTSCPTCGNTPLSPMGTGTQKVEQLLKDLFPQAQIGRLDRDVANAAKAEKVLNQLRHRELDILVGTQMVTKGHDFPGVTLVGVLQSDVGLHMPDFRAAERTFQLLTQVAGRAGRAELSGRAIIQTYSPDHPSVACAKHHDYHGFAQSELQARKELGYPPFGRLAAIRLNSPDPHKVEDAARALVSSLRDAWHNTGRPPVSILGPVLAPLAYVQNRHRWQIFLKGPRQDQIRLLVHQVLSFIESPPANVRIRLDVDPVSML